MSQKIIVIIGATGQQGGSVAKHLKDKPQFKLRAITRKPISEAAKELSSDGVEVIAGDLGNKDSIRRAFKDAWAVFAVTNYWEAKGKEEEHGINMIDIAKEAGIQYFVWSSVDHQPRDVRKQESKDKITAYLKASGLQYIQFMPTCYMENITNMWTADEGAKKVISIPVPSDTPLLWYSVKDTGAYVKAALLNPESYVGKEIRAGSEWATPRQVVQYLNAIRDSFKLDEWDQARFDDFSRQGELANEIHAMMTYFITHPSDHPIRQSGAPVQDLRPQPLKEFITSNYKTLTGAPRLALRGSGTYIPAGLRASGDKVALPSCLTSS